MQSPWRLPPLATILDPRPEHVARDLPIWDAANLPVDELGERLAELPPKDRVLPLADFRGGPSEEASLLAANFLDRGGRRFVWQQPSDAHEFADGRLWEPRPLLQNAVQQATGKRALDLGCGAGRDAVALVSAGCDVVGLDILPDAVDRMNRLFCRWRGEGWGTLEGAVGNWANYSGEFDLVIAFASFDSVLPEAAVRCLAPGGILAVEAFTTLDAEAQGVPVRDHHVEAECFHARFPLLAPIHEEAIWVGGRHRVSYIGRRA